MKITAREDERNELVWSKNSRRERNCSVCTLQVQRRCVVSLREEIKKHKCSRLKTGSKPMTTTWRLHFYHYYYSTVTSTNPGTLISNLWYIFCCGCLMLPSPINYPSISLATYHFPIALGYRDKRKFRRMDWVMMADQSTCAFQNAPIMSRHLFVQPSVKSTVCDLISA